LLPNSAAHLNAIHGFTQPISNTYRQHPQMAKKAPFERIPAELYDEVSRQLMQDLPKSY
jgi:hypothetical protein